MRGHGLRALLQDIQSALSAGGGSSQAKALGQLSEALKDRDDEHVSEIAAAVEARISEASAPAWQRHARSLKAAELDESKFNQAFLAALSDKSLKKSDIAAIAKDFGVRVDSKASGAKLLDQIKGTFYERLYERDADAMAKRATPW